MYADDIVLVTESAHDLQVMLNILHEWCNTLLAKNLCDSSFLDQHLYLIHSHFKTDRVMSFIF